MIDFTKQKWRNCIKVKLWDLIYTTMEPRFNEPLYSKDLDITNDILRPSNSKMYEKVPRYNETSLQRTNFVTPLALRYIDVPLYNPTKYCPQLIIFQVIS